MKIIFFSIIFLVLFGSFNVQKTEAKVWKKDLVNKVILTSGYKFQICPVALVQSAADIVANINITKEEEHSGNNPNSIECTGNKEDFSIANADLYFNLEKWPDAGSKPAPEQFIVFRDKMYSIQGNGSQSPSDHLVNQDLIATNPGLRDVKKVGIYPTDPKDYNPNLPDNTIKDSALTIFYNEDGKFSTFLFVFNNAVYKAVAIVSQITTPTILVDYTQTTNGTEPTPTNTTVSIVSPTPTPNPTASWKTYNNTANKFSLKYPDSWYIGVAENGTILFNDKTFEEKNVMSPDQVAITLVTISDANLIKEYTTNLKKSTTKNINGIEFVFIDLTPVEGPSSQVLFAQTIHDGKLYRFGLTNQLNQNVFDRILSTFKFTN